MRYCDYEKSGIHTRLKYVIYRSGGYNRILSAKLLMMEYSISDFSIAYEMALNPNIREFINEVGIEQVLKVFKKKIEINILRGKYATNQIAKLAIGVHGI